MKKQSPKAKRRQLSEIKKSIREYLNEGEARAAHLKNQQDRYGGDAKWGKMVPPPGYSDGSQRIPNFQSLDDLNRTLISFELNPINIQDHNESFGLNHTEATFVGQVNAYFAYGRLGLEVNNLIDSIYYPDEETKTNAFADPKDQIDDRIALQNFSKKSHAQQYDHPLNEVKKSRLTERFQQLAGIKPLYEIEDNIEKYIDGEDDISDIRGGKTIAINFNRKIYGNKELEDDLKDYASAKYGGHFELDWRDDQEVEIHMGNSPNPPPSNTPSVNDLNKYVAWKKKNFKSIHSPVSSKLK